MITAEYIGDIFNITLESSRVTIDGVFNDEKGEKLNAIYSIFKILNGTTPWGALLIHSDGGVKDFFITYSYGDFLILVKSISFPLFDEDFKNIDKFVDWLNRTENKIKITGKLINT